ncbi:RecQ-mediated genome instability protein [Taphrina deformans PYCC 5710]|uniref:RecQ-mediated genome instability protein 1 n=1 Tax=Taphrina deformans (strain PYCC 5710 / ATCC 11124 / CBS 356.35 / IMI 108563 / JCM 9778 / NBRC 8474) TaxID=1097556 RepID=R4XBR0_TAPDE|nr:RecQ-mediated genome instability protein [Taphrina deformans PYCC 5710]|eukprot:CCG81811.1 RecQ-mediated genome instability protein [Taphrina deformans PYCC 5710]
MDENIGRVPQAERIRAYFASLEISLSEAWLSALSTHLSDSVEGEGGSLEVTCLHHFLASDLVASLSPQSLALSHSSGSSGSSGSGVMVQVVACEEIGHSLTTQLMHLEDYEERQKPVHRRLIRVPGTTTTTTDDHDGQGDAAVSSGGGPSEESVMVHKKMCRVVVEDHRGTRMYGIESGPVAGLQVGMTLGAKLLLNAVPVVHGVLVLSPGKVVWLGGRVEALNQGRLDSRADTVARLKLELGARLASFPVMTQRDRQRAVQEQRQADGEGEEEEEGQQDESGQGQDRPARGRGSRGRSGSARGGRGRASRARGR